MKLEFEQSLVTNNLYEELAFDDYLRLFQLEMPVLSHMVLRPFDRSKGEQHFQRLQGLKHQIEDRESDLEAIITQSQNLPNLEFLLPFFQDSSLKPYHLFSLGSFLAANRTLQVLEKGIVLDVEASTNNEILTILEKYTQKGFSNLRFAAHEKKLLGEIEELEQDIRTSLSAYEKEILEKTGLKMIYPYPKELMAGEKCLESLQNCPIVTVSCHKGIYTVDYQLSSDIKKLVADKDKKSEILAKAMDKKLAVINRELAAFYDGFYAYYQKRKQRTFDYMLIYACRKHSLVFPEFSGKTMFQCEQAALPSLRISKDRGYVPLTVALKNGSNVVFGANMTGKTTVLKTVYFLLTMVRVGLPVPASKLELRFPEQVEMHFKSPGNIRSNLSSFGEEIDFFTRSMAPGAYVLVDEMFLSTDPINGSDLSEIFLSEFSQKDLLFLCTSHYPSVLEISGIQLFRMKDATFDEKTPQTLEQLLANIPYEIEAVSQQKIKDQLQETQKPLRIALHFQLSKQIKKRIQEHLDSKKNK